MIARCELNIPANRRYHGRGIVVCTRWRHSFDAFLEDMGLAPVGHRISIDRIDNDGHYEPGNCRWATTTEQVRNRSITLKVAMPNGRTMPVADLAEQNGISPRLAWERIHVRGWDPLDAVTRPALTKSEALSRALIGRDAQRRRKANSHT